MVVSGHREAGAEAARVTGRYVVVHSREIVSEQLQDRSVRRS